MSVNKIVCYLYTGFDKKEKLIDFVKNYKKNKSGLNHKLVICFKLLDIKDIIENRKYLKNINYIEFIDPIKKNDWDFGSYKRISKSFYNKEILFLNSHSYPTCNNWLKKLFFYKKKDTVIAPSASYESLIDSIKLKNKFHKIFRYLLRRYRFLKNFDKFPNPHIRTSCFLINSKLFLSFIKNKPLRNKEDTLKLESGKNSLTNYLRKKKIKTYVVNSEGNKYDENNWKLSETYCYLNKNKSLISDKHSRKYLKLSNSEKYIIRSRVWGEYL
jgi:hypothetical protein